MKGNRQSVLICVLLAALTFAVFAPVTRFDFINFDDPEYVYENQHIESGLTWDSVRWAFTSRYAGNWHPLTWISHALDIQFFGLKPGWHHLTNVLFHIANTILLFVVLKRMTSAFWRSAIVAALFALHPLHVESVAWISERKDVLSTFFFMLTLWAYAAHANKGELKTGPISLTNRYYIAALVLFALGLMSKPMLVTLPFVLLLLDFWPLKRTTPKIFLLAEKIPFFALTIASCIITFIVQSKQGAVTAMTSLPLEWRIQNALLAYCRYIAKTFWPVDLAIFYPYPSADEIKLYAALSAAILLIVLATIAISLRRKAPYIFVGLFWFFGTLVPVIGIIQAGAQSMADRYTYIPLIGLFILICWGAADIIKRFSIPRIVVASATMLVVLSCAAATRVQMSHWKDSISVFSHALERTRNNSVAHFNLGATLEKNGSLDEAIFHYQQSLAIDPTYADANYNMGHALAAKGDLLKAAEFYEKVFAWKTNHVFARNNLGNVLLSLGRPEEALEQYQLALEINPDYSAGHFNLGTALSSQGKYQEAIRSFREALRLKPEYPEALTGLGLAYTMLGDFEQALPHLRKVVEIKPHHPQARMNLANALADAGKTGEARREFDEILKLFPDIAEKEKQAARDFLAQGKTEAALARYLAITRLNPDDAEAHKQLGALFAQTGNFSNAQKNFAEATRLEPTNPENFYNLALSLVVQGKIEDAVPIYDRALDIAPDYPSALNDLAWILATHPSEKVRNGSKALRLARRACELTSHKIPRFLGTLDAALAETGQFEKAIETAQQARQLALASGETQIAEAAAARIALYQKNEPFRQ